MPKKIVSRPKMKNINLRKIGTGKLGPGAVMFVKDQCDCSNGFCDCDERPGSNRMNPVTKANIKRQIKR